MNSPIADRLLTWYARHRRQLPWRGYPDPYAVWVSEVMLQQTRVETVIPYFERWLKKFPTIAALANAPLQDVLRVWEGLGYYSRARNLHQAAQKVIATYGGELPAEVKELLQLPGIGRYTAGAIASICFDRDEPTLDGNIRRVLSRVFDIAEPLGSARGDRYLWELAGKHLPSGQAGDYNQALMDLGATICTPRDPQCIACPLQDCCTAYRLEIQRDRPAPKPRQNIPHHTSVAAVIYKRDRVLITQNREEGLLGGLWEFPSSYLQAAEDLPALLTQNMRADFGLEIQIEECLGTYHHAYTHFRVTLHAYRCNLSREISKDRSSLCWIPLSKLPNYPMGKLARQIARQLA